VKADGGQRTTVRLTDGVVNFVYRSGRPVVVREKTVQSIRQFQQAYADIEVMDVDFLPENGNGRAKSLVEKKGPATLRIETLNLLLIARPACPTFIETTADKI
jgi:transcription antitermination factor NusG